MGVAGPAFDSLRRLRERLGRRVASRPVSTGEDAMAQHQTIGDQQRSLDDAPTYIHADDYLFHAICAGRAGQPGRDAHGVEPER